jgi:hypothetical protein
MSDLEWPAIRCAPFAPSSGPRLVIASRRRECQPKPFDEIGQVRVTKIHGAVWRKPYELQAVLTYISLDGGDRAMQIARSPPFEC